MSRSVCLAFKSAREHLKAEAGGMETRSKVFSSNTGKNSSRLFSLLTLNLKIFCLAKSAKEMSLMKDTKRFLCFLTCSTSLLPVYGMVPAQLGCSREQRSTPLGRG